jgi:hypothetical protein
LVNGHEYLLQRDCGAIDTEDVLSSSEDDNIVDSLTYH